MFCVVMGRPAACSAMICKTVVSRGIRVSSPIETMDGSGVCLRRADVLNKVRFRVQSKIGIIIRFDMNGKALKLFCSSGHKIWTPACSRLAPRLHVR